MILRGLDERGFVFFTDQRSRKGRELAANPHAALVMHWPTFERQVRVEGPVELIAPDESDAYFARRPRGHQVGAWASRQSQILTDRAELEEAVANADRRFSGQDVPRPPYWGGYRIAPSEVELWQGRPDRLHDRVRYRRAPDGSWDFDRLWP